MKIVSEPASNKVFNRRDALKNMAMVGAGALAMPVLDTALTAAPASSSAVEVDAAAQGEKVTLTVKAVYAKARQALSPTCRVCRQCNGVACVGDYPGIGGIGSGMSFQNNFTALQNVKLNMRTLIDETEFARSPDTSTTIFGRKLSFPAFAAPIGPVVLAFGKGIKEEDYFDAIIGGCVDAGAGGGIGNNAALPLDAFKRHCGYIRAVNGQALIGLKPRPAEKMIPLFEFIEEAGAMMIMIDTDSGGRFPVAELAKITRATRMPIVVKGVMTMEDARRAADAGAAGIVVTNHGGRRVDHTPGTAAVLPVIAAEMKGKVTIFTDGCVHYGEDVLKYLALGADAVLVGRHLVRAAFGGGREGVALFMDTMRKELANAMGMTGVGSLKDITAKVITD